MNKHKKQLCNILSILILISFVLFNTVEASAYMIPNHVHQRLRNAVVLYVGSSSAFVGNIETNVDATNQQVFPIIKKGRTLVPIRFISESLGADVNWNSNTSTAVITLGKNVVKLKLGSIKMNVNGKESTLDVPAETIQGRIFIPLRAMVEALGKEVFYDRGLIVISNIKNIFSASKEKEDIDQIIRQFNDSVVPKGVAEEYREKGKFLSMIGSYDNALYYFKEYIKLRPNSPHGYNDIADVYYSLEKYDEAISYYTKALEIDTGYIPAYYSLGLLLYELEYYEYSVAIYEELITVDPNYISAYLMNAEGLIALSRYEDALNVYYKLIEIDSYIEDAYEGAGFVLEKLGRVKEAKEMYDKANSMIYY